MSSIAVLPAAALQVILGHLCSGPNNSSTDVANARLVCKRWADISCAAVNAVTPKSAAVLVNTVGKFKALTHVDLRYMRSIDEPAAASLSNLRGLHSLSLPGSPCWHKLLLRGAVLQAIAASCSALTRLDISTATDDLAQQLHPLQQLRALSLSGRITDSGLAQLSSLSQLQQLSLSCCDAISDAGLDVLTALPALRALSLQSCLQLGDAALALLGQMTQLTALSLSHSCEDASSAGLLSLSSLKQLRVLNLSAASEGAAPGALARLLAALPQLTALDVSYCEHVNAAVLQAIAGLQDLRVLGLSGASPGSLHSLRCLRALSKLQQLQMRWIGQLKESHVSFLPHLVSLTALDISYCRSLSSSGLQQLQWLPQLQALNMMAVASDDLSCLRALQQLTGLTVSLLPPSCKSWQDIAGLTQLQTLALRRCTITAAGRRAASSSSSSSATTSAKDPQEASSSTGTSHAVAEAGLDARCLAALQVLTALDCSGSSVDAAALATLQLLPSLQHVCLTRCQGVSNAVLGSLIGCSKLAKLDLRLRGSGCSWSCKGLLPLLQQQPGLSAVYVSEVPVGLPQCEEGRVVACSSEQAPLMVARDVGLQV
uniref:F-box domain-containing protein n=1 Tax=Tetradesmus obliquus TaxID=3088 RepID=A0A383W990_TETOB|eukprot:jgi/Sobl393_1/3736/SZX73256.1